MDIVVSPTAGRREWIGLGVLALACLLYAMDLTVLHLAVPSLSAALRPTSAELLWIIDIYGFLVAGSLITMGSIGDRIGRRRMLMIGASAFGVMSVLAAFAPTPGWLIAARALMGLAGATLAPSTLSLIFNMFRGPRQRSVAIGVWIAAFSAGGAIGPMIGGVLLERYWWGSVFLIAVPVMALLLILGPRVLPEFRDPSAGGLDLRSAGMSLVAVLAVVFGVKEAAQHGVDPGAVAAVVAGAAVGWLFVRRQRVLADPLIDLGLFRIPAFSASLVTNMAGIFVAVGYFLFVAQYLQLVLGLSPLEAGMWSLPSAAGFVLGSTVAPRFLHRLSPRLVLGAALSVAAAGLAVLMVADETGGLAVVVVGSVAISLALAPVFSLTTELIVGSAPPERAGAASGMSETGAELGGALGIAVLGSIGTAVYRAGMSAGVPAGIPAEALASARETLGGAVDVAATLPADSAAALLAVARQSFVGGFHAAVALSALLAVAAAALSVTMLRPRPVGDPPRGEAPHGDLGGLGDPLLPDPTEA